VIVRMARVRRQHKSSGFPLATPIPRGAGNSRFDPRLFPGAGGAGLGEGWDTGGAAFLFFGETLLFSAFGGALFGRLVDRADGAQFQRGADFRSYAQSRGDGVGPESAGWAVTSSMRAASSARQPGRPGAGDGHHAARRVVAGAEHLKHQLDVVAARVIIRQRGPSAPVRRIEVIEQFKPSGTS